MSRKRSGTVVKLLIVAAAVVGSFAETASAQVVRGTFRLPYDVRWGGTVLPAGEYSIVVDSLSRPAIIRSATGRSVAFVLAGSVDRAMKGRDTSLLLSRTESEPVVRVFNWREGNLAFVYKSFTKGERERLAQAGNVQAVPILMAAR